VCGAVWCYTGRETMPGTLHCVTFLYLETITAKAQLKRLYDALKLAACYMRHYKLAD